MPLLDRASWISYIKTSLGYPVVNVYMTDDMIQQQITFALMKVIPYVNAVEFLETSSKVTTFTDKIVYAVLRVHSTNSSYSNSEVSQSSTNYYDILLASSIYNQMGGYNSSGSSGDTTKALSNYALYNYAYEDTKQNLDPIGFRLIGNQLFIDGDNPPYTIEAVTDKSIHYMSEDYITWVMEYSLALCKTVCGEIRSHVKVTGSPIELNGESLKSEGASEKSALEEKLGNQMSLFFCTR